MFSCCESSQILPPTQTGNGYVTDPLLFPVPVCLITPKPMFERFIIILIDHYFMGGENTIKRRGKPQKNWLRLSCLIFCVPENRWERNCEMQGEVCLVIQAEVALKRNRGMLYIFLPSFSFTFLSVILTVKRECKQEENCHQLRWETTEVKSSWYLSVQLCTILFPVCLQFLFRPWTFSKLPWWISLL